MENYDYPERSSSNHNSPFNILNSTFKLFPVIHIVALGR